MASEHRANRDELVARLRTALEPEADVLFSYLYGSVVKGRERHGSDVDVAVHLDPDGRGERPEERALEIEARLELGTGLPVQVVALDSAPLELVHNILRTGKPLTCRDSAARSRFYVAHGRAWFDQANARRIFRHYQRRRIEDGRFGG
jgi:predicted nucleotidyltransferase